MPTMDWEKEGNAKIVYPEGTYRVKINKFERTESFKKKTPQVKWSAEIVTPAEHVGRPITEYTPLTDASLWRLAKFIQACGVDTSELKKMDTSAPIFDAVLGTCVGREVAWILVEQTTDGGGLRNDITEYRLLPDQEMIQPVLADNIAWDE